MRTKVFNDLLTWIEENLSAQMKVDDIAKKSGYSRRYIYQLFVDKLGITPIEYLRGRRLCQATNWLKLTKVSGRQIAKKLGYSCYQAFSRDFRQYFKVTPKEFRKNNEWDMVEGCVTPFISMFPTDCSLYEISNIPELEISGYEFSYAESIPYFAENRIGLRKSIILQEIKKCKNELYIHSTAVKNPNDESFFTVKCFIGCVGDLKSKRCISKKINSGMYFRYYFSGSWEEYRMLPTFLSVRVLPMLGLKRREVCDIEKIYCNDVSKIGVDITCDYYIPVS